MKELGNIHVLVLHFQDSAKDIFVMKWKMTIINTEKRSGVHIMVY